MPLPPTTTPPGRTAPCPTAPPRPPPTPPGPKPLPATALPTPTTASAPTPSAKPAPSPSATRAASTTSASAGPTPEPTSSCSSKTSTSGSSTPPPANYSASSPWIPAATTSPPDGHPGPRPEHPAKADIPNPDVGSGCPRCLETSQWRAWQDSNLRPAAEKVSSGGLQCAIAQLSPFLGSPLVAVERRYQPLVLARRWHAALEPARLHPIRAMGLAVAADVICLAQLGRSSAAGPGWGWLA
jgi:hypothetical protein